jgi:hypothetical protein
VEWPSGTVEVGTRAAPGISWLVKGIRVEAGRGGVASTKEGLGERAAVAGEVKQRPLELSRAILFGAGEGDGVAGEDACLGAAGGGLSEASAAGDGQLRGEARTQRGCEAVALDLAKGTSSTSMWWNW